MADEGIKKVTILREEFPPLSKLAEDVYGHFLRYRVISEDKNTFSHWSRILPLTAFSLDQLPSSVAGSLSATSSSITAIWDDEAERPSYDIFVRFNSGSFSYHGTSPVRTYSIVPPAPFTSVQVAIQISSIEKERSEVLTICTLSGTI